MPTVRVTVRYYSLIRKAAGTEREVEEVEPGCTLGTLIEGLRRRHGSPFRDLVSCGREGPTTSLILLDGRPVRGEKLDEPAADGAELSFFPPMAGG